MLAAGSATVICSALPLFTAATPYFSQPCACCASIVTGFHTKSSARQSTFARASIPNGQSLKASGKVISLGCGNPNPGMLLIKYPHWFAAMARVQPSGHSGDMKFLRSCSARLHGKPILTLHICSLQGSTHAHQPMLACPLQIYQMNDVSKARRYSSLLRCASMQRIVTGLWVHPYMHMLMNASLVVRGTHKQGCGAVHACR